MAPKKLPWFRFYVEAVSDVKLRRMKPEHRWLWVCVLAAARSSCVPGVLLLSDDEAWTVTDIADFAGLTERSTVSGLAAMKKAGMLTDSDLIECPGVWRVVNWDRRQHASDTSTERVRKHRATPKERPMKRSIDVSGTPPEVETDPDADAEPSDDHPETHPVEPPSPPVAVDEQMVNRALLAYSRIVTDRTPGVLSYDAFAAGVRRDAIAEGIPDDLRVLLIAGHDVDAAAAERAGRTDRADGADVPRTVPADESTHPLLRPVPAFCGDCEKGWVFTEAGALARCPACNPNPIGAAS